MNKFSKRAAGLVLAAVIILQTLTLILTFSIKHTGNHEDEFFSYGLANSYKRTFLYGSSLYVDDNYDVWMTGDDFRYYIRTNENTRFCFDSVWYNQAEDLTPPLYYSILHTICSIDTEGFSWWYAFAINLVSYVVTLIFLYLLAAKLSRSQLTALLICAFWGFTLIAQGNFLFLRMYSMATMFSVVYAYATLRLVCGDTLTVRGAVLTGLAVFLGAMTQHFFLVTAFFLTAFSCIWLLIRKQVKQFFMLGISAAAGVLLSIAVFPATIPHLQPGRVTENKAVDRIAQMQTMLSNILKNTTGFSYIDLSWTTYAVGIFGILIPLSLPLLFLFRKEPWMLKLRSRLKERIRSFRQKKHKPLSIAPGAVILFLVTAIYYFIVSGSFCYDDYGEDSERYYYQITPFMILLAVWFLSYLIMRIRNSSVKRIMYGLLSVVLSALLVFQNVLYDPVYIINADTENGRICEYTEDEDCILLTYSAIFLPIFCQMLEGADDVYFTLLEKDRYSDEKQLEEYRKIFEKDEPFLLLLDETALSLEEYKDSTDIFKKAMYDEEWTAEYIVKWFEKESGMKSHRLTAETVHKNRIAAYRFEPEED